ncbi:MAG TPA: VOC family protein [Streptosporangiaceae bacterium]|jgi:predicted enzyme related to lactoylglutathione lyase
MPTRLVHLVVDANDPAAQARFWADALGWVIGDVADDEVDVWPEGYDYPDPVALPLVFVPVPEPKRVKNRVHLDLASTSAGHQAELVSRLRDLGATPADIGQGPDLPWTVLADPEGNEFCVLEPREMYMDTGPVAAVLTDCADPARLARFWTEAAGWPVARSHEVIVSLRAPGGVGPYLEFLRVPDTKTVKNRWHADVAPFLGDDGPAEAARLRGLGATPADVGQGPEVTWTVLADPEGNEFCVLTPR